MYSFCECSQWLFGDYKADDEFSTSYFAEKRLLTSINQGYFRRFPLLIKIADAKHKTLQTIKEHKGMISLPANKERATSTLERRLHRGRHCYILERGLQHTQRTVKQERWRVKAESSNTMRFCRRPKMGSIRPAHQSGPGNYQPEPRPTSILIVIQNKDILDSKFLQLITLIMEKRLWFIATFNHWKSCDLGGQSHLVRDVANLRTESLWPSRWSSS